jgi:amino acid transporter
MLQSEWLLAQEIAFNRRRKSEARNAMLKLILDRFLHAFVYALLCMAFGFGFIVFGIAGTTMLLEDQTAHQLIGYSFYAMVVVCFLLCIYCLFRCLDEVFYDKSNFHRVTGPRS